MEKSNLISEKRQVEPTVYRSIQDLERIGPVAYRLELLQDLKQIHDMFHVSMLRKYNSNMSHVLEAPPLELKKDLSFDVQLVGIID